MPEQLAGYISIVLGQISETQKHTLEYLQVQAPEIMNTIMSAYDCCYSLLILPTGLRFKQQHYYPYNLPFYEFLEELDTSVLSALSGHYKAAIQHLRFALELAYFGIYLCKPVDEIWVREWLLGQEKTPPIRSILKDLQSDRLIKELNAIVGMDLEKDCYSIYDSLSLYVHTRGYVSMGTTIRASNIPMLNPDALKNWAYLFLSVTKVIAFGMIGRFPQALQGFPLFEKLGFAKTPRGGFLEPFEVDTIRSIFNVETWLKLKKYSDQYHTEIVKVNKDRMDLMPDLTLGELKQSFDQWQELMKQLDQGYIPGKTWQVALLSADKANNTTTNVTETSEEFIRFATYLRRRMDANDELMLAQAYTEDLFREKDFFSLIEAHLSPRTNDLIHEIYDWSKISAYSVWWNDSENGSPFFVFRCRDRNLIFFVFTILPNGLILLNYDCIANAIGEDALREFHKDLRSIAAFNTGLREDTNHNPAFYIEQTLGTPEVLSRFKEIAEKHFVLKKNIAP